MADPYKVFWRDEDGIILADRSTGKAIGVVHSVGRRHYEASSCGVRLGRFTQQADAKKAIWAAHTQEATDVRG